MEPHERRDLQPSQLVNHADGEGLSKLRSEASVKMTHHFCGRFTDDDWRF
jgi:hypothetical protein